MIKAKVPRNPPPPSGGGISIVQKEGWLLKKSKKNPLKGWKRRYVVVTDRSFIYSQDIGAPGKSIALDDRTRVRELEKSHDPARHLVFVVLKKGMEAHGLEFKAPTEAEKEAWRDALTKLICLRVADSAAVPAASPPASPTASNAPARMILPTGRLSPAPSSKLSPRAALEDSAGTSPRQALLGSASAWQGGKVLAPKLSSSSESNPVSSLSTSPQFHLRIAASSPPPSLSPRKKPAAQLAFDVWVYLIAHHLQVPHLRAMLLVAKRFVEPVKSAYRKRRKIRADFQSCGYEPVSTMPHLATAPVTSMYFYPNSGYQFWMLQKHLADGKVSFHHSHRDAVIQLSADVFDFAISKENLHFLAVRETQLSDKSKISVYSAEWKYLEPYATGLLNLIAIALDADDGLCMLQRTTPVVRYFRKDRSRICQFGTCQQTEDPNTFRAPSSLAISPMGSIIVSDSELHAILVFSREGNRLRSLCTGGALLRSPAGMEVDSSGRVFVCDAANNRIWVLATDGTILHQFGDKLLKQPRVIRMKDDGAIFVIDREGVYTF